MCDTTDWTVYKLLNFAWWEHILDNTGTNIREMSKALKFKHFILHDDNRNNILYLFASAVIAVMIHILSEIFTHFYGCIIKKKWNFSWCLVHRFCTVHITINQSFIHNLPIATASVCLSVILSIHQTRLSVFLSGASLWVCPSRLSAYVRLSVWHSLSAGGSFNGGPCHISLGLSYWVPLYLSTGCCHQQLPSGNLDHLLDLSLNSSHCYTFSWGQLWHLMVMFPKTILQQCLEWWKKSGMACNNA